MKRSGTVALIALACALGWNISRREGARPLPPAERQELRDAPNDVSPIAAGTASTQDDDFSASAAQAVAGARASVRQAAISAVAAANPPPVAGPAGSGAGKDMEKSLYAALPASVDLSWQFGRPRNQGDVGDCHAFAAVALLEAAEVRQYGTATPLSEADLEVQGTILDPRFYFGNFIKQGGRDSLIDVEEGGWIGGDVRLAIANGLAVEPRGGYEGFLPRYRSYFLEKTTKMSNASDAVRQETINESSMMGAWSGRRAEPDAAAYEADAKRFMEAWEFLDRPDARGTQERLLGVPYDTLRAQRASARDRLKGFQVRDQPFAATKSGCEAEELRGAPPAQLQFILGELAAKRPVGVAMDIGGLPEWVDSYGGQFPKRSWHAFVITGFAKTPHGLVFHIRNSWGSYDLQACMSPGGCYAGPNPNPDIPAGDLCAVQAAVSVLAPRDQGK